MLNLSVLSRKSLLGRAVRWPLRYLPRHLCVRILQGPGRGLKWLVGAGVHGFWLGTYEVEKQLAICNELRPGSTFYDVGANVGLFSLIAARHIGEGGQVVAFEPWAGNVDYLRKHVSLNGFEQRVHVVEAAVGASEGMALFQPSESPAMGRLSPDGSVSVPILTLDSYVEGGGRPPDVLKVDVEGAELQVLKGAKGVLMKQRPVIFLATHGPDLVLSCRHWLFQMGFEMKPLLGHYGEIQDEFIVRSVGE